MSQANFNTLEVHMLKVIVHVVLLMTALLGGATLKSYGAPVWALIAFLAVMGSVGYFTFKRMA